MKAKSAIRQAAEAPLEKRLEISLHPLQRFDIGVTKNDVDTLLQSDLGDTRSHCSGSKDGQSRNWGSLESSSRKGEASGELQRSSASSRDAVDTYHVETATGLKDL